MTAATSTFIERFRQWPRAMQWAAIAGAIVAAFFLMDSFVWPLASAWSERADNIQRGVSEVRADAALAGRFEAIKNTVKSLGPVELPETEAEGNAALNDIYNSVRKNHQISNDSFEVRKSASISGTPLAGISKGKSVSRLTGELKFESTPEVAMAIITELESSPMIESISSVRITRDAQPKVKVQLTIEAWVYAADVRRGGGA
jgi:hypothetical protein